MAEATGRIWVRRLVAGGNARITDRAGGWIRENRAIGGRKKSVVFLP